MLTLSCDVSFHDIQSQNSLAVIKNSQQVSLDRFDNIEHLIKTLPAAISKDTTGPTLACTVLISGSAERAAGSFPLVRTALPMVFQLLNESARGVTILRDSDIRWLEHEFHAFHLAVITEVAEEMGLQSHSRAQSFRRADKQSHDQLRRLIGTGLLSGDGSHKKRNAQRRAKRKTKLDTIIVAGRLILSISESSSDISLHSPTHNIDGVRLVFFPRSELLLPGSGLVVSANYDTLGRYNISPAVSTFGIIGACHPVWEIIEVGDMHGVERLLGGGEVQPCDRDAVSGNSLLAASTVSRGLMIPSRLNILRWC